MRLVTDIRGEWPRIRSGLDAVLAKCREDWIPEDVYHALKSGNAACYTNEAGILIVTRPLNEFTQRPELHVWITHNEGAADVLEEGIEFLREQARHIGATRITFASPRLGWSKRFPMINATYEVPL